MPRRYRSVFAGHPHHVIQRGNRRQHVFFSDGDRKSYLTLLREACNKYAVKIWAYCLMTNHVHLVLAPSTWESLALAVGDTHRAYTKMVNKREGWQGYLWEGRFRSFIMGETYFRTVMRYVELNPVRAGIVHNAIDHPWSSARSHVKKTFDFVLDDCPLQLEIADWEAFLKENVAPDDLNQIRRHASTGRPFGDETFCALMVEKFGADILPQKRGPKPKNP